MNWVEIGQMNWVELIGFCLLWVVTIIGWAFPVLIAVYALMGFSGWLAWSIQTWPQSAPGILKGLASLAILGGLVLLGILVEML